MASFVGKHGDDHKDVACTRQEHDAGETTSDLPPYGSQAYWEDRYRRVLNSAEKSKQQASKEVPKDNNNSSNKAVDDASNNNDDPLAYHSWYFTYHELRPIIMPLILGDCTGASSDDDDDDLPDDEDQKVVVKQHQTETALDSNNPDDKKTPLNPSAEVNDHSLSDEENNSRRSVQQGDDNISGYSSSDADDGEGSLQVIELEEESDDDQEQSLERTALAKDGPVFVLEIGCGDVPLGTGLALDLLNLEQETKTCVLGIVKKIVCVDYSSAVIECMKRQYRTNASSPLSVAPARKKQKTKSDTEQEFVNLRNVPLEFATQDARSLPYPDDSVDLVLEKGTLDAMLSDKQQGTQNCVQTISECARVLRKGGYMLLVSHFNAHAPRGISWLEEIVFNGLQQKTEKSSTNLVAWEIEVHGNDGTTDVERPGVPEGSIGPAVYVIHKMEKAETTNETLEDNVKPTIPVKFFSY